MVSWCFASTCWILLVLYQSIEIYSSLEILFPAKGLTDGTVEGENLGTPSLRLEVMTEGETWNFLSLGSLNKSAVNGPLRLEVMVEGRNMELPLFFGNI